MLYEVFDRLKVKNKLPIFISFNNDSLIRRLKAEKPLDTMLRAIAVALMTNKPANRKEAERVRCTEEALQAYLAGKKNVVLIVDELNILVKPNPTDDFQDVGLFLRDVPPPRRMTPLTFPPALALTRSWARERGAIMGCTALIPSLISRSRLMASTLRAVPGYPTCCKVGGAANPSQDFSVRVLHWQKGSRPRSSASI